MNTFVFNPSQAINSERGGPPHGSQGPGGDGGSVPKGSPRHLERVLSGLLVLRLVTVLPLLTRQRPRPRVGFGGAGPNTAGGPSLLPSKTVLVQNVTLILGWGLLNPSQADVGPQDRELHGVGGSVCGRGGG